MCAPKGATSVRLACACLLPPEQQRCGPSTPRPFTSQACRPGCLAGGWRRRAWRSGRWCATCSAGRTAPPPWHLFSWPAACAGCCMRGLPRWTARRSCTARSARPCRECLRWGALRGLQAHTASCLCNSLQHAAALAARMLPLPTLLCGEWGQANCCSRVGLIAVPGCAQGVC